MTITPRRVGLWLGPLLAILVLSLPFPSLTEKSHQLSAIVVLVIVWWITETLPLAVTGLVGVGLTVAMRITPVKSALESFVDPIVFLFIGSFLLAKAMQIHGVDKRIAQAILGHPWVGSHPFKILAAFGLTAFLLAMWTSITACAAMLFPIALAVGTAMPGLMKPVLFMLSYGASAGAMATPIGTPPNMIGISLIQQATGIRIGFFQWMSFALPLAAVLFLSRYGLLILMHHRGIKNAKAGTKPLDGMTPGSSPWTRGQQNTVIAFATAVILWIFPGVPLSAGTAAMVAASLLFLLPLKKFTPTLGWKEASSIDWGTILLFASGIALGRMMVETGLAAAVGHTLLQSAMAYPKLLLGLSITVAAVVSELASNTAAASMIIPVMLGLDPNNPHFGVAAAVAATLGASIGFMLPVSTAANAIIYSSKKLKLREMIVSGLWVDVISILIIWAMFAIFMVPTPRFDFFR